VAEIDEIVDGAVKSCSIDGVPLVITRLGDRFGALAGRCPHAGGPLGEGTLESGRLVCPWHGREYDPITGVCDGYDQSVQAYPIDVRADGIYVST
jgi:pyruvate oxidase